MSTRSSVLDKLLAYQDKYGFDGVVETVWTFCETLPEDSEDNRLKALVMLFDKVNEMPYRSYPLLLKVILEIVAYLHADTNPAQVFDEAWEKGGEAVAHSLAVVKNVATEAAQFAA